MKKILVSIFILVSVYACTDNANDGNDKTTRGELDKKVTKRDLTITSANAFNDLFLDSNTLESFITEKKPEDAVIRRMRSFYNARNYQFAWFSRDGLTEHARGFWNIHDYHTSYLKDSSLYDKEFIRKMNRLIAEDSLTVRDSDKNVIETELSLTQHLIIYALNNYKDGAVKRKELERFIPSKKADAMYLADSLLNKEHKDDKYFEDINESYGLLKDQLNIYYQIAKQGGWPVVNSDKKQIKIGASSPEIALIKRRLQITGDMPGNDTSQVFNDTLEMAVKHFQQRHGYTPNGVITEMVIRDMNVPVAKRIQELLINIGRMQWMISQPKGDIILVNIPEFVLHVRDGNRKLFDMRVVVGKEGHNTMMFNGYLNQVVFSPYWNVPQSIVEKEILPEIAKNPNYLQEQQMEITGDQGDLPEIRQLPGEKNSLGKVKFLFPNSFDIYFHDTPAKSLFRKDKRAYSHGCIRLSDPVRMAKYLLQDQREWTPEKITTAMNDGKEKFVKVKDPVPVFISYYTAWVDESGILHFREDIYDHDAKIARKMFVNPL